MFITAARLIDLRIDVSGWAGCLDAESLSCCFNLFYLIEVTRGSGVEMQRNLPDHFEWLLAVDDEVDEVALTAGEVLNNFFAAALTPNTCRGFLRPKAGLG